MNSSLNMHVILLQVSAVAVIFRRAYTNEKYSVVCVRVQNKIRHRAIAPEGLGFADISCILITEIEDFHCEEINDAKRTFNNRACDISQK
jgi:hypothetical protein